MNQQTIKHSNMRRIYSLISHHQADSRSRLAKVTNLSKTTVSSLVEELIQAGYIAESGVDTATLLGRKPSLIQVNAQGNFVAVVSWRHNLLIGALLNTNIEVVAQFEVPFLSEDDYVDKTAMLLRDAIYPASRGGRILGTCIVVPSMVDDKRQQIISTVLSLPEGNNVVQRLHQALQDKPLAILNDTACYAYAEYVASHVQENEYMFVNVGKGVGAVMISRGVMMRGANGMTTQFGHSSIDRHGPMCECGNRGCLEHMVGEGALNRLSIAYGLEPLLPCASKVRFCDIGALAAAEQPQAIELIDKLAGDLAYGLSNLITLVHPQLIVIGGFGVNLGQRYLDTIRTALKAMGFPQFVADTQVRFACVDEHAELSGAVEYYLDQHLVFDGSMQGKLILS